MRPLKTAIVLLSVSLLMAACAKKEEVAAPAEAPAAAPADKYSNTVALFKNAGQSSSFFDNSYGYAVFPTIGKAGRGIGGSTATASGGK